MDILLHGYCRENILDGIIILQEIYIRQFENNNDINSDDGKLCLCILQHAKGVVTNKSVGFWSSRERGLKHLLEWRQFKSK